MSQPDLSAVPPSAAPFFQGYDFSSLDVRKHAGLIPHDGKYPLTYHSDMARWQRTENGTRLDAIARGQEFILDTKDFPEAIVWLKMLLDGI